MRYRDPVLGSIVLGVCVSVGVFVTLFTFAAIMIAARHRRIVRELEPEGIERRSGRRVVHLSLRNVHTPGALISFRKARVTGELVLTRQALVVLASPNFRFDATALRDLVAEVRDGRLHLTTEHPPGASGRVEITIQVDDADA